VTDTPDDPGIRERLSKQGEEALGKLAEELATNPIVAGAVARAFDAREKAVQAQEAAMGALGIPSAADIERLTRRLRSVSQRLEGIEDAVDRLDERLESIEKGVSGLDSQLGEVTKAVSKPASKPSAKAEPTAGSPNLEQRIDEIARDLAALRDAVAPGAEPPPRAQERLTVTES
jgi:chromosome segregation ATPase